MMGTRPNNRRVQVAVPQQGNNISDSLIVRRVRIRLESAGACGEKGFSVLEILPALQLWARPASPPSGKFRIRYTFSFA